MFCLQDALDIFKRAVQEVAKPGNTALDKTCVNKEHSVLTGALNSGSTAHRGRIDTEQLALVLAAKRLPTIHGQLRNEHRDSKTWRWFSDVISSNCHFMAQPYKILQAWNPLESPGIPTDLLCICQLREALADGFCLTSQPQGFKGARVTMWRLWPHEKPLAKPGPIETTSEVADHFGAQLRRLEYIGI